MIYKYRLNFKISISPVFILKNLLKKYYFFYKNSNFILILKISKVLVFSDKILKEICLKRVIGSKKFNPLSN